MGTRHLIATRCPVDFFVPRYVVPYLPAPSCKSERREITQGKVTMVAWHRRKGCRRREDEEGQGEGRAVVGRSSQHGTL
eukprot:484754-Rhodomonas_salina.1